jgi:hypothetical protein
MLEDYLDTITVFDSPLRSTACITSTITSADSNQETTTVPEPDHSEQATITVPEERPTYANLTSTKIHTKSVRWSTDVQEGSDHNLTAISFVDAHMHFDTLRQQSGLSSFHKMLDKGPGYSRKYTLQHAVANFCGQIPSLHEPRCEDPRLSFSLGLHPRNVRRYDIHKVEDLIDAIRTYPKVVGIGEKGMDYSGHSIKYRQVQQEVFR